MKDSNPESRSSHLLSCPLSAECVRMLDSIDEHSSRLSQGVSFDNDDTQEHLRATQLAAHIKSCETCQVAITDARKLREQQRSALRDVMDEGEALVPATTASILLALRHEYQESQGLHESREHIFQPLSLLAPEAPEDDQDAAQIAVPSIQRHSDTMPDASDMSLQFALVKTRYRQHAKNKRKGLASIVVVAGSIAAIILFTLIGVFNHTSTAGIASTAGTTNSASSVHQKLPASSTGVPVHTHSSMLIPSSAYTVTKEWSAVALVQRSPDGMSQMVKNYDPVTDKSTVLSILPLNASLDAISYQGDNMIFRQYDASAQSTSYYLLRGGNYSFGGKTSNAIWSADDSSIFVATPTGEVSRVDLSSGKLSYMALNTPIDQLLMVRGSYLYFTHGNILYRASVQGDIAGPVQLMVSNADLASFWLDPYTNDLYYYRKGSAGSFDLYTAPVGDSTNGRLLVSSATLIGYGDVKNLIVLQYKQGTGQFDVLSVDKASGASTVISQIALGAQALCQNATAPTGAICSDSVALSPLPDNQALIIGARYGGAYRVQIFGLVSSVMSNLFQSDGDPVQLIGWDKLAVS
ncbi:hypothetical protein ccbrp13_67760 [Ktedonobacteria bacterium brp13]|nr:hypothetical protein ccbrp13_67760 [Ktedonobacteria bacterium brp13]